MSEAKNGADSAGVGETGSSPTERVLCTDACKSSASCGDLVCCLPEAHCGWHECRTYGDPGPGGHNIFHVKRARRAHSDLLVFIRKELATPMTPSQVLAQTLKRLYPQNPDVVLGREARVILHAFEEAGFAVVATDTTATAEPLCGGCNPPPHGERITQSVWLCPEHQAKEDALLAKYGEHFIPATKREDLTFSPIFDPLQNDGSMEAQ